MKRVRVLLLAVSLASLLFPASTSARPFDPVKSMKVGATCATRGSVVEENGAWYECRGSWKQVKQNAPCASAGREAGYFVCAKRAGARRWTVVADRKFASCDPNDPRIAAAGLALPATDRPEARIAAACVALEWITGKAPSTSLVTVVRSPRVVESWDEPNRTGLLVMERLLGRRFKPLGAPIRALIFGDDMEWACTYGRKSVDPLIPYPDPWTEQWLGCKNKTWPCGGSNVELTNNERFVFSGCKLFDLTQEPNESDRISGWRFGHELVHILQTQLKQRTGAAGDVGAFEWAGEGIPIYLDMAAAWLAGYEGDWRLLEDRTPYQIWRQANPNTTLSIRLLDKMQWDNARSPLMQMRWMLGALATEYLIAHWGFGAPFKLYQLNAAGGLGVADRAFGLSKTQLYNAIDAYIQQELEP